MRGFYQFVLVLNEPRIDPRTLHAKTLSSPWEKNTTDIIDSTEEADAQNKHVEFRHNCLDRVSQQRQSVVIGNQPLREF